MLKFDFHNFFYIYKKLHMAQTGQHTVVLGNSVVRTEFQIVCLDRINNRAGTMFIGQQHVSHKIYMSKAFLR